MTLERTWLEPTIIQVPEVLRAEVGGHPLIAETLFRRGLRSPQAARAFLDPASYRPRGPADLPDMRTAVNLIARAVQAGTEICVWGDFDVDGQTATTLLVEALRDLGASVRYYIPQRERESHGLHPQSLKGLLDQGIGLIITCDTGVTAHEAVDLAHGCGAQVIITDHHDLPPELPDAEAVLNPKRLPAEHPLRELPGVGVAYKLAQGCYDHFQKDFPTPHYAELTALGIVSDLALQVGDVRYLLQCGLEALRHTSRPALLSLYTVAGLSPIQVNEEQITFGLAPRLNSLGRMDDANRGVQFLSSLDRTQTDEFAAFLDQLNTRRKLLTDQIFEAALQRIEARAEMASPALIVTGQDWPGGVLGIVASRLVEIYGKPALVLSQDAEGKIAGSARSIPGVDVSAAISSAGDLLDRYGGHPMAAGLQMEAENLEVFKSRVHAYLIEHFGEVEPSGLQIDGYLALSDLDLDVMQDFDRLAPFGPGNPDLVFACREYEISDVRTFGPANEHQRLLVEDGKGRSYELIHWRGSRQQPPGGMLDLAYSTRINHFRGEARLQLEWVDCRLHEQSVIPVDQPRHSFGIQDWRWDSDPRKRLAALDPSESVELWVEGMFDSTLAGTTRGKLQPAPVLVIWTAPPDRKTLLDAVVQVHPGTLIVAAVEPDCGDFESFLRQLAGMVKFVLRTKEGCFEIPVAAEQLGSLAGTVRLGMEYLALRGMIDIREESQDSLQLAPGSHPARDVAAVANRLQEQLVEAAAFRSFLKKCDLTKLVVEID
ncbi:MAG: single-stranded-DNA-specific exonuclease RecJ [Anaerolineales bacterium]